MTKNSLKYDWDGMYLVYSQCFNFERFCLVTEIGCILLKMQHYFMSACAKYAQNAFRNPSFASFYISSTHKQLITQRQCTKMGMGEVLSISLKTLVGKV